MSGVDEYGTALLQFEQSRIFLERIEELEARLAKAGRFEIWVRKYAGRCGASPGRCLCVGHEDLRALLASAPAEEPKAEGWLQRSLDAIQKDPPRATTPR